jgi:hypothetical protein
MLGKKHWLQEHRHICNLEKSTLFLHPVHDQQGVLQTIRHSTLAALGLNLEEKITTGYDLLLMKTILHLRLGEDMILLMQAGECKTSWDLDGKHTHFLFSGSRSHSQPNR